MASDDDEFEEAEDVELGWVPETERADVRELQQQAEEFANTADPSVKQQARQHLEPLTLLRFLRARDSVASAFEMFQGAMTWRAEVGIDALMQRREAPPKEREMREALAARHFYASWLRGETHDGSPVGYERIGRADLAGMVREELVPLMLEEYIYYLETGFRAVCRASQREQRLVRARILVDCDGLSFSSLYNVGVIKQVAAIGPPNYPEVTAGVDIIRAPWLFAKAWGVVSPLLPEKTRKKVRIVGHDFEDVVREYVPLSSLPNDVVNDIAGSTEPTEAADESQSVEYEALRHEQEVWSQMPEGDEKDQIGQELMVREEALKASRVAQTPAREGFEGQALPIPAGAKGVLKLSEKA